MKRKQHLGGLFLAALLTSLPLLQTTVSSDLLELGSRRVLFVDRSLVETLEGTELRLQHPQPAGVAIRYDQPWEDSLAFYSTVLYDGEVYRMYYRCRLKRPRLTCYAESRDGIHWRKPMLGLVEVDGSKDNNVILPFSGQFCAFLDKRPGVPVEQRFKANARDTKAPYGLVGFVSADGVHWKKIREKPIVDFKLVNNFDSQNVMFWSEAERQYVLYARHMEGGRRSTARSASKDFLDWTSQTLISYSDTGTTTPSQHLYTNQTHPYFRAPHLYISLPGRIHSDAVCCLQTKCGSSSPEWTRSVEERGTSPMGCFLPLGPTRPATISPSRKVSSGPEWGRVIGRPVPIIRHWV